MRDVASSQSARELAGAPILKVARSWQRSNVALMVAIAGLGLALTTFQLGTPSLWMDEAFSVELARKPLSTLWLVYSSGGEANMGLYYLILHGWLNFLSFAGIPSFEFEVRLPSAVFVSASAVVVFTLGRQYVSQLVGGLGAILLLLNSFVLATAQLTRSYSLQLLLVTLSWYALLSALTHERRVWPWWVGYTLLTGASLYAQLSTVFIVCSQVVFFAVLALAPTSWRTRARTRMLPALLSLFAIGLLFAPIALASQGISKTGWLARPTLSELRSLYLVYAFGNPRWQIVLGLLLCGAGVVATLVLYFARRRYGAKSHSNSDSQSARQNSTLDVLRRPTAMEAFFLLALLSWLTVPVMAAYIVSQGTTHVFSTRYLVIIIPALVLLVATGAMLVRVWFLRLAIVSAFLIPAVAGAISYYPNAQIEDWRTPTRWIEQSYQTGDGLVIYNNSNQQGAQFPVQYYLHTDGSPADFDSDSPGVALWERLPEADPFAHYQDALDPQALSRYATLHHRFFFVAGRFTGPDDAAKAQTTIQWLNSHYQLVGQSSGGAATVLLYSAR